MLTDIRKLNILQFCLLKTNEVVILVPEKILKRRSFVKVIYICYIPRKNPKLKITIIPLPKVYKPCHG